jgi:hypothetical protein
VTDTAAELVEVTTLKENMMNKPQWILDIERTTGLCCEYNRKAFATDYWNVVTPTGMKLFEVYSTSDTEIGGCRWPGLYALVGRE